MGFTLSPSCSPLPLRRAGTCTGSEGNTTAPLSRGTTHGRSPGLPGPSRGSQGVSRRFQGLPGGSAIRWLADTRLCQRRRYTERQRHMQQTHRHTDANANTHTRANTRANKVVLRECLCACLCMHVCDCASSRGPVPGCLPTGPRGPSFAPDFRHRKAASRGWLPTVRDAFFRPQFRCCLLGLFLRGGFRIPCRANPG